MTDDDMRAFLRRIRRDMAPRRESILWLTWASTVASLGYKDMRAEVAGLKREGFIPDGDFNGEDFDLRIALAQSDASGLAAFEYDLIAPLADATSAILSLAGAEAAAAGRRLRTLRARKRTTAASDLASARRVGGRVERRRPALERERRFARGRSRDDPAAAHDDEAGRPQPDGLDRIGRL